MAGITNFQCAECGKNFKTAQDLDNHLVQFHGENPDKVIEENV